MNLNDFSEIFKKYLEKIEIVLDETQIKKFYDYMNLLIEWNEKINLTAIVEPKEIILKHFVDSLTICKYIKENETLADVGTGAGFPGIPISIVYPKMNITLVDSLNKRINFLNEVINKLNLKNVKTYHSRIEDFGKDKNEREKYDIVTARAVANLSTLSEYLIPITKIGGKCLCMKGSNIEEEIINGKNAIKILGGKIEKIDSFNLPLSDIERNIVIISKINKTPNRYPRKAGLPSKEPIK